MFPLLSLANELVIAIVESINDRSDLIALAQTCKKLQSFVEPRLFRTTSVINGQQTRDLTRILQTRPSRYNYIHRLEATPTTRNWDGIQLMPAIVRKLTNLRELWIESPLCNGPFERWWVNGSEKEYMDMLRMANVGREEGTPLGKLESFRYNSHGINSRFLSIESVLPVFFSSTLTRIHISCLRIVEPIHVDNSSGTPLKTLVLEECTIKPATLYSLLSLPRSLESLSIRESRYAESGNDDIAETFRAIRQQKRSLQFLQHEPSGFNFSRHRQPGLGLLQYDSHSFSDFTALTTLSLSQHSLLTELMLIPHLVPPALSHYTLANVDFDNGKEWEAMLLKLYKSGLKLEVHLSPEPTNTSPLAFMANNRVHKVVKLASLLKERGIIFTLIAFKKYHCVPPYLFLEWAPTPHVLFESSHLWELEEEYEKETKAKAEGETKVIGDLDRETAIAAKIMTVYQIRNARAHGDFSRYAPPPPCWVDTRPNYSA